MGGEKQEIEEETGQISARLGFPPGWNTEVPHEDVPAIRELIAKHH